MRAAGVPLVFVLACVKLATPSVTQSEPVVTTVKPDVAPPTKVRPLLFEHADDTCGSCASTVTAAKAACAQKAAACESDPHCVAYLRCAETCKSPGDACMQKCTGDAEYAAMLKGNEYLFCTCCRTDCLESCRGTCAKYRSGLTGPVGAGCTMPGFDSTSFSCNSCLDQLFLGGASTPKGAYAACLAGDFAVLDCIDGCHDAACMQACRRSATGASLMSGTRYLGEACCGPCAQACAKGCKERGVQCP